MKKRPITLIEIMIVIFLIGLIGGVLGYNMKGSLEEGKAFKTEQAMIQVHDILLLEVAKGTSIDAILKEPQVYLTHSGFVKDPANLLKDGWGTALTITATKNNQDFKVISENLKKHYKKKGKVIPKEYSDEEEDESPPAQD